MHFAIRFLTEYVYDAPVTDNLNALRVRPATTSGQRCDEFTVRIDPEARVGRHLDYFGTEVLEFGIARPHEQLTIDVRARVVTAEPPEPPDVPWPALDTEAYAEAAGEYLASRARRAAAGDARGAARSRPRRLRRWRPCSTLCDLIPDRFEYRKGATYVGSTVAEFLDAGARGLPGLRPPRAHPAAPPRDRGALRHRATCGPRPPTRATTRSRSRRTPGSRRCCPGRTAAASRSGSAPIRPTAASPARRT